MYAIANKLILYTTFFMALTITLLFFASIYHAMKARNISRPMRLIVLAAIISIIFFLLDQTGFSPLHFHINCI